MNQQTIFNELNKEQKFQFLYHCAKANMLFIQRSVAQNFTSNEIIQDAEETVVNAFDFLGKFFLPKVDVTSILNQEVILNGLADELVFLIEEIEDLTTIDHQLQLRALACLSALEGVYTLLVDDFFGDGDYDLFNHSFQVILLAALGNFMHDRYSALIPNIKHGIYWKDLSTLEVSYPGLQAALNEFMANYG